MAVFAPLELYRASSTAQETKAAIAAYEDCLNAGDSRGLAALRATIERRIDDLESFYLAHVDDERSVLFEKQRLKLRKLLHEYDSVQQQQQQAESADNGADGYGSGVVTKTIHEDSRLSLEELIAWFEQAGIEEMPEVTPAAISAVFSTVTRTNRDGHLSIRDLRQWYITFGRHALAAGLDVSAPGAAIVAPALMKTKSFATGSGAGAPVDGAATQRSLGGGAMGGGGRTARGLAAGNLSGRHAAAAAALLGESVEGGINAAGSLNGDKPMYAWEKGPALHSAGEYNPAAGTLGGGSSSSSGGTSIGGSRGPSSSSSLAPAQLQLPNGLVEFQVRLTPEEYADLALRRRMAEAEARYKRRVEEGRTAASSKRAGGAGENAEEGGRDGAMMSSGSGLSQLRTAEPYVDPADRNAYFLRSD